MTDGYKSIYSVNMAERDLIKIIEHESKVRNMAPATLCRHAVQNQRLYQKLKSGGSCSIRTANRLLRHVDRREIEFDLVEVGDKETGREQ